MELSNIVILQDRRTNGLSVSAITSIEEYILWYKDKGEANKLPEQRPVLNTRSANTIRKRLIQDLMEGAVIPPIVIGVSVEADYSSLNNDTVIDFINSNLNQGTVIDGMQRTAALLAAIEGNPEINNNPIRLDFWLSNDIFSLVYRMLVLNTGQTPWDIKRQMEVVYGPMLNETVKHVKNFSIHRKYDGVRRKRSGEYTASSVVELFLAFSTRKDNLNNNEKIADDFTRLDVTQLAGTSQASELFYDAIDMLCKFDLAISRFKENDEDIQPEDKNNRFTEGMDLFTQNSAKIGFIVALAQAIMGRAGSTEKTVEEQKTKMGQIRSNFDAMIAKIEGMDDEALTAFLAFDVLREKIASLPPKNIGAHQRAFYRTGFGVLIESAFVVDSLEVAWQAY